MWTSVRSPAAETTRWSGMKIPEARSTAVVSSINEGLSISSNLHGETWICIARFRRRAVSISAAMHKRSSRIARRIFASAESNGASTINAGANPLRLSTEFDWMFICPDRPNPLSATEWPFRLIGSSQGLHRIFKGRTHRSMRHSGHLCAFSGTGQRRR